MKREERWLWAYRWATRKVTSSYRRTEQDIRREHPDAVKVPGSMVVVEVPETDEEKDQAYENMRRPTKEFRPE